VLRRVAEAGVLSASRNRLPTDTSPSISAVNGHSVGTNQNTPVKLFTFLGEHAGDPALKVEANNLNMSTAQIFLGVHTKTKGPHTLPPTEAGHRLL
jgi:hypothetical protein